MRAMLNMLDGDVQKQGSDQSDDPTKQWKIIRIVLHEFAECVTAIFMAGMRRTSECSINVYDIRLPL